MFFEPSIFICFRIGEKVPFAKRGRIGVVHGSVIAQMNPFHCMIETGSLDELSEESLMAKVNKNLAHYCSCNGL